MRYDNEAGKGDHRHLGGAEYSYRFEGIGRLMADFEADMRDWIDAHADRQD